MSYLNPYTILSIRRPFLAPINKLICHTKNYAKKETAAVSMLGAGMKKKKGKLGPVAERKALPVVEDPVKLVNYVCGSNILKTGEDIKVQPDSEYPEWLWSLRTGPAPTLDELDPNTKEYWYKVRKMGMMRNNKLAALKKF